MGRATAPLDHFVGRVHRRMTLLRVVERIAMTLLAGCGFALLGAVALWLRAKPSLWWVEACLIGSAAIGAAWGMLRRSTLFQAAVESDRQLDLPELIGTAWLIVHHSMPASNVELQSALLRQADAACGRRVPPSARLGRMGRGMWGAVPLAVGLVLVVALMGPAGRPQVRQAGQLALAVPSSTSHEAGKQTPIFSSDQDRRPILAADPDDPNASTLGQNESSRQSQAPDKVGPATDNDTQKTNAPSEAGRGGGAGHTEVHAVAAPLAKPDLHSASESSSSDNALLSSGGAGAPTGKTTSRTEYNAGVTSTDPRPAQAPPPWSTDQWPADVSHAQAALDAGTVPSAYRDLVREYFSQ